MFVREVVTNSRISAISQVWEQLLVIACSAFPPASLISSAPFFLVQERHLNLRRCPRRIHSPCLLHGCTCRENGIHKDHRIAGTVAARRNFFLQDGHVFVHFLCRCCGKITVQECTKNASAVIQCAVLYTFSNKVVSLFCSRFFIFLPFSGWAFRLKF